MRTLEIKGDGNSAMGQVKQKWATLADDDLHYVEGTAAELLGRIQRRTGETCAAIKQAIKDSTAGDGGGKSANLPQ